MTTHVAKAKVKVMEAERKAREKADDEALAGKYMRFMPIALATAMQSKDPSTKVGALVLGPGNEIRSSGWNGAPRGCAADEDVRYFSGREERLFWAVHAEANAIANAARAGTALAGGTLICTHTPCMSCAKLIVQAGIVRVFSPKPSGEFADRWKAEFDRTRTLFEECGVQFIESDISEE